MNPIGFLAEHEFHSPAGSFRSVPKFKLLPPTNFGLPHRFVSAIYDPPLGEMTAWQWVHTYTEQPTKRKRKEPTPPLWMFRSRGNHLGDRTVFDAWVRCRRWLGGDRAWTSGWHVFTTKELAEKNRDKYLSRDGHDAAYVLMELRIRGVRYLIQQPVMGHPVLIAEEIMVQTKAPTEKRG